MTNFLSTGYILLTVFTLSSTLSLYDESNEALPFEYPKKTIHVEDKELRDLVEDVLGRQEHEREKERKQRLEWEREREAKMKWRNELGEGERESTGAQGFSPDSAIPAFSQKGPVSKDNFKGKHKERQQEIEKERTDYHGRKEKERIRKMQRERQRQKTINGQITKELEKGMRGHRQRLVKDGKKLRVQEQRFRSRSRSREDSSRI